MTRIPFSKGHIATFTVPPDIFDESGRRLDRVVHITPGSIILGASHYTSAAQIEMFLVHYCEDVKQAVYERRVFRTAFDNEDVDTKGCEYIATIFVDNQACHLFEVIPPERREFQNIG